MIAFKKNLIAGLLATIPLWITWLVVTFILGIAVDLTGPLTRLLVEISRGISPGTAEFIGSDIMHHVISIILLLFIFYWLGWFTTHLAGRKIIKEFDRLLERIPFIGKVYGGTKRVIQAFQEKPDKSRQVVLIDYPHPGMKTIGLVTKTLTDNKTGKKILAVYVPTTPNPTSGFLELVPLESVTLTDWTVNDAIAFIVSGGSVGPEEVAYSYRDSINIPENVDGGDKPRER